MRPLLKKSNAQAKPPKDGFFWPRGDRHAKTQTAMMTAARPSAMSGVDRCISNIRTWISSAVRTRGSSVNTKGSNGPALTLIGALTKCKGSDVTCGRAITHSVVKR